MAWTSLDTRDALAGNIVGSIQKDADGSLLFATDGGVTRYRRSGTPPRVHIASIEIMEQLYTDLAAIPAIIIGSHMTIAYGSIDLKTVPEKRQYRYRIYETQDAKGRLKTQDSRQKMVWSLESGVLGLEKRIILPQGKQASIGYLLTDSAPWCA
jgi:hypothetical protein